MIRVIYPQDTATLYEATSSLNTSLDETVRISKVVSGSGDDPNGDKIDLARTILRFGNTDLLNLSSSHANHKVSATPKYKLKMFVAAERSVAKNYTIEIGRIPEAYRSWVGGVGRKNNNPSTTNGVAWGHPVNSDTDWAHKTGSLDTISFRDIIVSQSFEGVQGDIDIELGSVFYERMLSDIATHDAHGGILASFATSSETTSDELGEIIYFSKHTNTIYSPRLEFIYDDTPTYTIDGLTHLTSGSSNLDIKVNARVLPEYKRGSTPRIILDPEPRFIARSQTGAVSSGTGYGLPNNTQYAIIDESTGEHFIGYDSVGTKVAVSESNYFDIDTNALYPERYYRIQLLIPDLTYSGSVSYYDIPSIFKVVR